MSEPVTYYFRADDPALIHKEAREVRSCERCKYARKVLVRYHPVGDRRDSGGKFLWRQEITWNALCSACEDEAQAQKYEALAVKLRRRARETRAKRGRS